MILKPKDILENLLEERQSDKNVTVIFFLNEKKEIISTHKHFFLERSEIKMSDIFIPALYMSASFLIIAQVKNNTKKVTEAQPPTQFEKDFTKKVIRAGTFLKIKLLDHLIVTKNVYYSFHESGFI